MRILSHRGFWRTPEEQNTAAAFAHSFAQGFGTATDLRDGGRSLVASHDPADADAPAARELFAWHACYDRRLTLALNIKADGLLPLLTPLLAEFRPADYFCFDLSVPETRRYLAAGVPIFTRQSDGETSPPFLSEAAGIWADAFTDDNWLTPAVILGHLSARRRVCVVSPELHGRDPTALWERILHGGLTAAEDLLLCTDRPDAARNYFA
jgi:hypothetical protein